MKGLSQHLLTSALVVTLAFPTAVSAHSSNAQQETHSLHKHAGWKHSEHGEQHRTHQAHKQQYMILLAEKYTPDKVAEWKAVFAEREQLCTKWKSLREKQTLTPQQAEKQEQYKKYKAVLRQKLGNGEITKEQMKTMLTEWKEKNYPEKAKEDAARRERHAGFRQTRDAFDQAIKTGNEDAIRAVLPQLLAQEKAMNQYLANKLEQKKN